MQSIPLKTRHFYQTIQAGDIALFNYIPEALFFVGHTKAGKTSSCHILCNSPLRAELQRGELVYRPSTNRYLAKVGNLYDSETEIPNIFETEVRHPETRERIRTVVLDQPGYGDSYGFHRIFSNGYFHYRSFSKTGKIKFVLTFSQADLLGSALIFKNTIFNFINSFNKYAEIRDSILAATSFLITKVDQTFNSLDSLRERLVFLRDNAVRNIGNNQRLNFQSLITNMVQNNKIYFIEKPTRAGVVTAENTLLQKIYFNSQFWERPKKQNSNLVSMQYINFSVAGQVLQQLGNGNELFNEDFLDFMKFTQERVNDIFFNHQGSLQNLVKQLMYDAQASNQSNNFLYLMRNLNEEYYKFDAYYNKQRIERERDLFKQQESESFSYNQLDSSRNNNNNTYFIKKFKVLQALTNIYEEYVKKQGWNEVNRTIEQLQQKSIIFRRVFKNFSILGKSRQEQTEVIYRYSYIIQRLIEEYKIITLILFSDRRAEVYFNDPQNKTFSEDVSRLINDRFFTTLAEINMRKLKMAFVYKFDFEELNSITEDVIQFFQDLTTQQYILSSQGSTIVEYINPGQLQKKQETLIIMKVAELLKKYYKQVFQGQPRPANPQKVKVLKKLFQYRNKLYYELKSASSLQIQKQIISYTVNLTRLLAKVFLSLNNLAEAKDCYISINDVNSLLQIHDQECKSTQDRQTKRRYLVRYGEAAEEYGRRGLAKQCFQMAYSLSETCDEMMEVGDLIVHSNDQTVRSQNLYDQTLRQGKYCLDLSEQIKKWFQIN